MNIYTQTPLRISFLGGGSDYQEYFNENEGAVLGSSIDKYIYIFQLPMSSFSPKKYKLSYRKIEEVDELNELTHPVVKNVLAEMNWNKPINISTMSDIPGGTGLGSSSSFTIGMIKLMHHLAKNDLDRISLAKEAFRLEHDILRENVGIQDHLHAAFGGLNLYRFQGKRIIIEPVQPSTSFKKLLNQSLILVYTKKTRYASKILDHQVDLTVKKINTKNIKELVDLTIECAKMLNQNKDDNSLLVSLGKYLQKSWELKKTFSGQISNSSIDDIYEKGMSMGALGGKLCGAGGGGFVLFLLEKNNKTKFIETFGANNVLDISLINEGSVIKGI